MFIFSLHGDGDGGGGGVDCFLFDFRGPLLLTNDPHQQWSYTDMQHMSVHALKHLVTSTCRNGIMTIFFFSFLLAASFVYLP